MESDSDSEVGLEDGVGEGGARVVAEVGSDKVYMTGKAHEVYMRCKNINKKDV